MASFLLEFITDFVFIAGTFTIGFGVAAWVTALVTKNDWQAVEDDEGTETETEREVYEKKFEEEFKRLDVHDLNDEEKKDFKHSVCVEECPRGKVIMRYNLDEETFEYFTNSRNIPHSYLDVVAKKFIIENDCKIIYKLEIESNPEESEESDQESDQHDESEESDQHEESDKEEDKEEQEGKESDKEEGKEEESVFATFKKREQVKHTPLIVKVINKYKSVGTIHDYEKLEEQNKTNNGEEKVITLTFKDYKNMVKKNEN